MISFQPARDSKAVNRACDSLKEPVKTELPAGDTSETPLVSVVMPVLNEAFYINRTMEALLDQDYPADRVEILISDGGSSDSTFEQIQAIVRKHPERTIRLLSNPKRNPGSGLNIAIRASRGEIILRMDGHAEPAPDYIRQCVRALLSTKADNVGGPICPQGINYFSKVAAVATTSLFGNGGAKFRYSNKEELVDTVPFGAWRRELFSRLGYFIENRSASEDAEFNARIRDHGGKVLLTPVIRATYYPRHSATGLWKQYLNYGQMKWRVNPLHVQQMRMRHLAPALFILSLFGGMLDTALSGDPQLLLAILGIYAATNLGVSVYLGMKRGWKYLPLLPAVFSILHFSYGLGSLLELIRFTYAMLGGKSLAGRCVPSYNAQS